MNIKSSRAVAVAVAGYGAGAFYFFFGDMLSGFSSLISTSLLYPFNI